MSVPVPRDDDGAGAVTKAEECHGLQAGVGCTASFTSDGGLKNDIAEIDVGVALEVDDDPGIIVVWDLDMPNVSEATAIPPAPSPDFPGVGLTAIGRTPFPGRELCPPRLAASAASLIRTFSFSWSMAS